MIKNCPKCGEGLTFSTYAQTFFDCPSCACSLKSNMTAVYMLSVLAAAAVVFGLFVLSKGLAPGSLILVLIIKVVVIILFFIAIGKYLLKIEIETGPEDAP